MAISWCYSATMVSFRRRTVRWSITGGVRHAVLLATVLSGTLIVLAAGSVAATAVAARIALPMLDDAADRRWAEALAPLSSLPERYPVTETGDAAHRLDGLAASLGISLEENGAADPAPPRSGPVDPAVFAAVVTLLTSGDAPAWAMDVFSCEGAPSTSLDGHLRLQRLLLATARLALESGSPVEAERMLEASWQLNDQLLRSPSVAVHRTACVVVEQQMTLLRSLPEPAGRWRVRLAALDLEAHALESYRFEAWRLRCRADRFLMDVHPLLGAVAAPVARLLAHRQHDAMLFAVRELPQRDIRVFDPDAFVAEQHARVPRTNPIARDSLPVDWTSWPDSVRAALDVELALRVLELRARWRDSGRGAEPPRLQPRQPSRVAGIDWIYGVEPGAVTVAVDGAGWRSMLERPLTATVALPAGRGQR